MKVGVVVGFPHGYCTTKTKVFEAEQALADGAVEVDMVLHIGRLLSRDFDYVRSDIKAVADAAHKGGAIVKVILENCYLTDELKVAGCKLCEEAGADFVKTSTGFAKGGATLEDLALMRKSVSPKVRSRPPAAFGISRWPSRSVRPGRRVLERPGPQEIVEAADPRGSESNNRRLPDSTSIQLQGVCDEGNEFSAFVRADPDRHDGRTEQDRHGAYGHQLRPCRRVGQRTVDHLP